MGQWMILYLLSATMASFVEGRRYQRTNEILLGERYVLIHIKKLLWMRSFGPFARKKNNSGMKKYTRTRKILINVNLVNPIVQKVRVEDSDVTWQGVTTVRCT